MSAAAIAAGCGSPPNKASKPGSELEKTRVHPGRPAGPSSTRFLSGGSLLRPRREVLERIAAQDSELGKAIRTARRETACQGWSVVVVEGRFPNATEWTSWALEGLAGVIPDDRNLAKPVAKALGQLVAAGVTKATDADADGEPDRKRAAQEYTADACSKILGS